MKVFYVDDSGSRTIKGPDKYFCLGAFSVDAAHVHQLKRRLDSLKKKFGLDPMPRDEVKFNQIGRDYNTTKKPNPFVRLQHDRIARRSFGMELLIHLTKVPSTQVFTVAVDLQALDSYESPVDWAIKILGERFQYSLKQANETGLVICDEEEQKNKDMRRSIEAGTAFTPIDRLNDTLLFAPSHLSAGVQFADFVAGAAGRWWNHQDDSYLRELQPSIYRGNHAQLAGAGIKVFRSGNYPIWAHET